MRYPSNDGEVKGQLARAVEYYMESMLLDPVDVSAVTGFQTEVILGALTNPDSARIEVLMHMERDLRDLFNGDNNE